MIYCSWLPKFLHGYRGFDTCKGSTSYWAAKKNDRGKIILLSNFQMNISIQQTPTQSFYCRLKYPNARVDQVPNHFLPIKVGFATCKHRSRHDEWLQIIIIWQLISSFTVKNSLYHLRCGFTSKMVTEGQKLSWNFPNHQKRRGIRRKRGVREEFAQPWDGDRFQYYSLPSTIWRQFLKTTFKIRSDACQARTPAKSSRDHPVFNNFFRKTTRLFLFFKQRHYSILQQNKGIHNIFVIT